MTEKKISLMIQSVVEALDHNLTRLLGDGARKDISDLITATTQIKNRVEDIERYIGLTVPNSEAAGADFSVLGLDEIISRSKLIGAINRAGVDIKSISWFSVDQKTFSRKIGTYYRDVSLVLKDFRSSRRDEKTGEQYFQTANPSGLGQFISILESSGVCQMTRAFFKINEALLSPSDNKLEEPPKYKPFNFRKYAFNARHIYKVFYKVEDSKSNHLVLGDWMTAFVADVIEDHLRRNRIQNSEVFCKVAYSAPVEIIKAQSDFDIIALISNKALCFECKTGSISQKIADDVTEKSRNIKLVLEKFVPSISSFDFYIVYDEIVNNENGVGDLFRSSIVKTKKISEIRELIMNGFSNPA